MKKLIMAVLAVGISISAFADYIIAWEISDEHECGMQYCRCTYEADSLRFTVTIKTSFCPLTIQIDPETRRWRR